MKLFVFDLLYLNGEDLRNLPLKERKEKLRNILPKKSSVIFYSEDIDHNGIGFFKKACQYKLEGIVSKDNTSPYRTGRSSLWCKSKCTQRQEFVIGGFSEGRGNRQSELGALLLGVYEKDGGKNKFRYVGKVGSGFDFKLLNEIKNRIKKIEQKKSSFDINSPIGKGIHWTKPKLIAEIKFSNWTRDYSLRNPVFLGFRNDKAISEVVMEHAVHVDKKKLKDHELNPVTLTHPDKILFIKEKISKKNIVDYYQSVSKLMIPHIKDRPLSLLRCPNGTSQKCFYQKHLGTEVGAEYFHVFEVEEKSKTGTYLSLDSPIGLTQLVQMNAFEIHVWNSHYQTLMYPDQIVLDFDPSPDVNFKTVVNGCFEMKKILDQLKLKSFVKLTGGKGIHIHIPIEPLYTWDQIKAFSKAIADEMVSRNPNLYLSTMSKKLRSGKIFVDYLRNAFGATAVAPYSIRAKDISAVALPVEWNELPDLKSSDQFTIKKAMLKIKNRKSDPWKKILSIKQKITMLN